MALTIRIATRTQPASPEVARHTARELMGQQFGDRILLAYVDEAAASERVLPVVVVANIPTNVKYYEFEKELADKVFGPVASQTKVHMPFLLTRRQDWEEPEGLIRLFYQRVGV